MRTPPGPSLSCPAYAQPPVFIRSAEVAKLLGYASPASFREARHRLEEDEDLPPPARTAGREYLWRRDEILAWLDRPLPPVEGVPGLSAADLAADRAVMMRMAGAA